MKIAQLKGLVDTVEQLNIIHKMNKTHNYMCNEANNDMLVLPDISSKEFFNGPGLYGQLMEDKDNSFKINHDFLKKISDNLKESQSFDGYAIHSVPTIVSYDELDIPNSEYKKPFVIELDIFHNTYNNYNHIDTIYGYGRLSVIQIKRHCLSSMYNGLYNNQFFILDKFNFVTECSNVRKITRNDYPDFSNLTADSIEYIYDSLHGIFEEFKEISMPEWFQNFEIMR